MNSSVKLNRKPHGIVAAVLAAAFALVALGAPDATQAAPKKVAAAKRSSVQGSALSPQAQQVARWAVESGDHKVLPFIIVDKLRAKAHAFDSSGKLIESTPVLIGMGMGDKFPTEVLSIDMYATQPSQRVTPAGRFFAEEGTDDKGETVLWVDYDLAIAIHRMPTKKTKQRRAERMASRDPAQHRITYGCINVPPAYYDRVVHPNFRGTGGMVYVLPDSTPLTSVFTSLEPKASARPETRQVSGTAVPASVQRF